jgi:multimeric flavodoxin WrbA
MDYENHRSKVAFYLFNRFMDCYNSFVKYKTVRLQKTQQNRKQKPREKRRFMKVVLIHGNTRQGSTWHCAELLLNELNVLADIESKHFSMPKDLSNLCVGCFSCLLKGEAACPHAQQVQPIAKAILEADVIVLASPVYAMDTSGGMKNILDHLCYLWLSHRPDPKMFNKVGVVIATTAGAGLAHAMKTMRTSLQYWGIKRVFSFGNRLSAMSWSEVSPNKKKAAQIKAEKLAKKIVICHRLGSKTPNPIFRRVFFSMMAGMMRKNTWNLTDKTHWEKQGWLNGKRPF